MNQRLRLTLLTIAMLTACTRPDKSREVLQQEGYTNIEITGWSPFMCSEDDEWSTGFEATNAAGQRVEGTVCCGTLTKGCTIRH